MCAAALAGSGIANAAPARPKLDNAPFRLCVLDEKAIVQRSRLAQNMGERFQQVRRQAQAKLDEDRRRLEADARALDSLRASLPAAVAETRTAELAGRREKLKAREEQINRSLASLDDQLTDNAVRSSEPFVRAVEAEQGCSVLLERRNILHLRDMSLDITPIVIERMNAPSPMPSQ